MWIFYFIYYFYQLFFPSIALTDKLKYFFLIDGQVLQAFHLNRIADSNAIIWHTPVIVKVQIPVFHHFYTILPFNKIFSTTRNDDFFFTWNKIFFVQNLRCIYNVIHRKKGTPNLKFFVQIVTSLTHWKTLIRLDIYGLPCLTRQLIVSHCRKNIESSLYICTNRYTSF